MSCSSHFGHLLWHTKLIGGLHSTQWHPGTFRPGNLRCQLAADGCILPVGNIEMIAFYWFFALRLLSHWKVSPPRQGVACRWSDLNCEEKEITNFRLGLPTFLQRFCGVRGWSNAKQIFKNNLPLTRFEHSTVTYDQKEAKYAVSYTTINAFQQDNTPRWDFNWNKTIPVFYASGVVPRSLMKGERRRLNWELCECWSFAFCSNQKRRRGGVYLSL